MNSDTGPGPGTSHGSGEPRPRLVMEPIQDAGRSHGYSESYGYGYGYGEGSAAPHRDPMSYVRMLYRRRWTIAIAFVLVLTVTVLRSFTMVPVYEARVRILTESNQLNLVSVPDVIQQNRADTQQAILRSRWLAKRTLEALKVPVQGAAGASAAVAPSTQKTGFMAGAEVVWGWISGAAALATAPYHWVVDPPTVVVNDLQSGETPAEAAQISAFLAGLILPPPQTGLMEIGYRSSDPVLAARYANAITQSYIDLTIETRSTAGRDVAEWLAARLGEQRQAIESSEKALQDFREKNGIVGLAGGDAPSAIDDRLGSLNSSVVSARAEVIEKESLYKQAQSLRSDPAAAEMLSGLLQTPALQETRRALATLLQEREQAATKLGERHPQMLKLNEAIQAMQSQLRVAVDRAVQGLAADLAAAEDAAAKLERIASGEKRAAIAMNRKSTELRILERDVESNRQIYQMLAQRARETTLAEKVQPQLIRVLDPAQVPLTPVAPNKPRSLMIGALGGLLLGLMLAFAFELLDNRIKHPEEVEALLKVPFLGLVPAVPGGPEERPSLLMNGAPPHFVESIRRLRTNVLFSVAGDGPKVVVITSSGAGEGKTVVSTNLAVSLAQAGQRVMLIDADMRRPRVHHVFGKSKEPGLSNLLVGKTKLSEVTILTTVPSLWIMPSGHHPPNAAELLGSPAFKRVLTALREHFDWVVIDSPPVMAVTDAAVAAHVADGVLFVIGAEMASHQVVRRAIEQCRVANINVVGAILNRVELEKHSYYYAPYYSPGYGSYLDDTNPGHKKTKSA
jgi:succinoglycan biosynthesis transport protein ExoP